MNIWKKLAKKGMEMGGVVKGIVMGIIGLVVVVALIAALLPVLNTQGNTLAQTTLYYQNGTAIPTGTGTSGLLAWFGGSGIILTIVILMVAIGCILFALKAFGVIGGK